MRYTSADFGDLSGLFDSGAGDFSLSIQDAGMVFAALRIASRVMAEGVIEQAFADPDEDVALDGYYRIMAEGVRAVLLEDAGTTYPSKGEVAGDD